jgi:cysteinyl-tRNA synthetase
MGNLIDIHGGGKDLIFPHHTNEIAQTMAAVGTKLANYWLHNGFVNVKGEKMSKSLKNYFAINEVLKQYDAMVIRFYLTSVNYGSPISYSVEGLDESKQLYEKIRDFYGFVYHLKPNPESDNEELLKEVKELHKKFKKALDDDINTAEALSEIYQLIKIVNSWILEKRLEVKKKTQSLILKILDDYSKIFGVVLDEHQKLGKFSVINIKSASSNQDKLINPLVDLLIEIRSDLRKKKVYDLSDKIRDKLKEIGIELDDLGDKTLWKIKK